ncbi:MAG: hypothetical protein WC578_03605 [Candidatus Omnitrophota bacterium]
MIKNSSEIISSLVSKLKLGSYILRPDVVLRSKNVTSEKIGFTVSPLKNVRMSLKSVLIKKNHKILPNAKIYIITIVTDDISSKPLCINSHPFEGIGDGDYLPLGPAGLDIYRSPKDKLPSFLDYRIMVMKSDKVKREIGELICGIQDDTAYKSLFSEIVKLLAASDPKSAFIIKAANIAMEIIGKKLKMAKDDQLIYIDGSLVQSDYDFKEYPAQSHYAEVVLKLGEW